jgi:hypothetical protein
MEWGTCCSPIRFACIPNLDAAPCIRLGKDGRYWRLQWLALDFHHRRLSDRCHRDHLETLRGRLARELQIPES